MAMMVFLFMLLSSFPGQDDPFCVVGSIV